MSINKILSEVASIIRLFILLILTINNTLSSENQKIYKPDLGTLSLIYHRFGEPKYPSTNVEMDIFIKQIELIRSKKFNFITAEDFMKEFDQPKKEKKVLLTIDDAFTSFYLNAWPYLKKEKIPFILFVSTEPVGKFGYMSWKQIKEVNDSKLSYIGNHSHTHEYLVNFSQKEFEDDINKSIKIFKKEIGSNPKIFSYPFGEYSLSHKDFIKKNFDFSFGQHSGVIDFNKDRFELPRFPINEKYGDLKRFEFLVNLEPLQYKKLLPEDKLLLSKDNPTKLKVEFFEEQKNIQQLNCFSNEGDGWKNSNINFQNNILEVVFKEKFLFRRGRVNCSLNDNGIWRWFGTQFTVKSIKE